jgi:16S rRNA (uracil1498-N3)-methyltransferase
MRRRFFVERFGDGVATLAGEAAHHLGRVLRAEPGQTYELSDGETVYLARVREVRRDAIEFSLVEPKPGKAQRVEATLLLAIVKFDRFEWALEKATELGVREVVPLAAERSEKALIAAAGKRSVRWKKILLESAQQARCLRPPALDPLTKAALAFRKRGGGRAILLSERAGAPPLRTAFGRGRVVEEAGESSSLPVRLTFAAGPEGGWTDAELAAAQEAGFAEASLGTNILRTETAVVAGLAAAQLYFGE